MESLYQLIAPLRSLAAKIEPGRWGHPDSGIINDLFEAAEGWRGFAEMMIEKPAADGWNFTGRLHQELALIVDLRAFHGAHLTQNADYAEIVALGSRVIAIARQRRPNPDGVLGSNRIIRETFAFLQSDFGLNPGPPPEHMWQYRSKHLCVDLHWPAEHGSQCRVKRPEERYGGFELEDLLFMGGVSASLALPAGQEIKTEADVQAWFTTVATILRDYGSDVLADRPGAFERLAQAAAERERLYVEECDRLYGPGAQPGAPDGSA